MVTVKQIRDASRADKDKFAQQKLGVTFYKQGIKGPMATKDGPNAPLRQYQEKKATPTPTPKKKPAPPAKTSSGKPGEDKMARDQASRSKSAPRDYGDRMVGGMKDSARSQSAPTSDKITGSNIPSVQPPPKPRSGRDRANDRADAFLKKYKQDEANKKLVKENADQVISTVLAFSGGVRRVGQAVFNVGLKAARSTQAGRTAEKYITEGAKKLEAPLRKLTAPQKRLPAPDRPPPKASNSLADKGSVGRWRQQPKPKPKGGKKGTGTFSSGYAKPPKSLVDKKMGGTARVKPPKKSQRKFTVENDPWQY